MTSGRDDEADLKARLARLESALKTRRAENSPPAAPPPSASDAGAGAAMSLAMKAGSEFVAAIIVGGAFGWGLDWLLHSRPLFTILFFFLGVAAGVWNVIRATSPKGGGSTLDSRLSHTDAADKGLRRSAPAAESPASPGREAQRGTEKPSGGADDDED